MTKGELEEKIRKFCSNMVYIFISDADLNKGIFGKWANRIREKKASQIRYLRGLSTVAGMAGDLTNISNWIRDEIGKTYAPLYNPVTKKNETATPELIIYHLCLGENIGGINWNAGVFGVPAGTIGKTYSQDFGTNGVAVDATTGAISINGSSVNSTSNYQQIMTAGAKKSAYKKVTSSYFDPNTRTTYTAKLNKNGQWYAYSTTNQAGKTIKVSSGSSLTAADGDIWDNINNLLAQINEMLNTFASYLSGESVDSLTPSQVEDGWIAEEDNSGIATAALIAGGLLVTGVVLNSDKKGKKANNIKEA